MHRSSLFQRHNTRSEILPFNQSLKFKNRIRELRFKAGEMTQQELADSVGVTRQTIIALKKGSYYPSLALAFRIAQRFGLPLENVFQFEG